ncbi:MAG TPA: hypothetical protein PKA84_11455 [Rubrivivax sp.]|jgi:hypothetical protein|nr:hypothetical protein [Thauera sp.]MCB1982091.1 hypothetical protein [Rhodoferax sp.]MCL4737099.1 hypothetical protein [Burkholderiaceae bacterium]MCP5290842.1 hypothetical protein [Burkholderiaceae bacterium]HMR70838.1 hypothetical protein [Rubrivivax sp.]
MKSMVSIVAAMALTFGAGATLAHDDATLDEQNAPHGGQLRMAGAYHLELVLAQDAKETQDSPVLVYVTDHAGTKIQTGGATGHATVLSGKTKVTAALQPDGDNRLKGMARYAATPGIKAVVSVTLSDDAPVQARFTPLARSGTTAQDGQSGHISR